MNRSLLVRMIALVVVLAASFYFIAFDVAQWRIGAQDYHVTVDMPAGGGIYTEADVTYRGVTVGRVTHIGFGSDGIAVTAEIYPGIRIPADTLAQVRQLSAAGEQYLDFVPEVDHGPFLHAGSVVGPGATSIPLEISQVLADTSGLLNSIDTAQLNEVTNALGTGFGGTGAELRSIIVAGQALFTALEESSAATVETITGGNTVLRGADATNAAFGQFATGLEKLSGQLKASNGDVGALLSNGNAAAAQANQLLSQYAGALRSLIANAGVTSNVTLAEQPEVQALFQLLPVFAGRIASIVHGGSLHVQLAYNTSNPVCPYIPGAQTALPTARTGAPDLGLSCSLPTPGALARGAG